MTDDANERYERMAAEFYRLTGFMAPGKDVPPELSEFNEDARLEAWASFRLSQFDGGGAPTQEGE